ncbi:MAG: hypothetical protein ACRDC4_00840 [Plesiomonas sp.]
MEINTVKDRTFKNLKPGDTYRIKDDPFDTIYMKGTSDLHGDYMVDLSSGYVEFFEKDIPVVKTTLEVKEL